MHTPATPVSIDRGASLIVFPITRFMNRLTLYERFSPYGAIRSLVLEDVLLPVEQQRVSQQPVQPQASPADRMKVAIIHFVHLSSAQSAGQGEQTWAGLMALTMHIHNNIGDAILRGRSPGRVDDASPPPDSDPH